ncbi:Spy/CpxP family protein refolding chaperone [Cylindrospermopsis raciborskii]|uniref:Spy/CpxP family protein refolding chaperone n=1 Tax=Cylindrospermopsis raciborskii TaxID=77022 RepID=UPI0038CF9436
MRVNSKKLFSFGLITLLVVGGVSQSAFASERTLLTGTPVNQTREKRNSFQRLNLTSEQQAKIRDIRRDTHSKIEGVLTPEQKIKFQAAVKQRETEYPNPSESKPRYYGRRGQGLSVLRSLGLTKEQKNQIREIRASSRQQIQSVLTPEQRSQWQQFQQRNRRQYR